MSTPSSVRSPPGPVARVFFRVPLWLWRLGLGRPLGRWLLLLEHRGRRTGRTYRTVLEVVARDEATGEVYAASGFAEASSWFRNLLAHPEVTIETAGRRTPVEARVLDEAERERVFALYSREHPWRRRTFARDIAAGVPLVGFRPRSGG